VRRTQKILQALGDPSRIRLLQALIEPSSVAELASRTGLRQNNISNHLARLRAGGLVGATRRGRIVEYRLADATVAQLVESLSVLAGPPPARERVLLMEARTCYDHLAGRLGVALFDGLVASGALRDDSDASGSLRFGPHAVRIFGILGIDLESVSANRRRLAFRCLDWTERRPHVGGALGAALASAFLRRGLVRRRRGQRGLDVLPRAWLQIESMTDYPGSHSQTKDRQQRTRF